MTKALWIGLLGAALSGCQVLWGFEGFQAASDIPRMSDGGEEGSDGLDESGSGGVAATGGSKQSDGGARACAKAERGCVGRPDELLAYVCSEGETEKDFSRCQGELSQCSPSFGCVSIELDPSEISLRQYFEFVTQSKETRDSGEFSPFSGELEEACEGTDVSAVDANCAGEMSYCRACVECEAEDGDCAEACADCDRDLPVVCVNWCQAMAYCRFQGGRLCGGLGPQGAIDAPAPFSDLDSARSPEESAWSHACAATAPWSRRTYSPGLDDPGACVFENRRVLPAGTPRGCSSVIEGYSDLNHLSGNVAEWEDSCADGGDPSAACRVRGGSFRTWNEAELACSSLATMARDATGPHVGFRCCYPGGR